MSKQRDFYHVSLKAILKNADGNILILKTNKESSFAGLYDLPGGRIDEDEFSVPLCEILKREIMEEVGLEAVSISEMPVAAGRHCLLSKYSSEGKNVHIFYVFYEAYVDVGDINVEISDEHEGFKWVNLKNIELEKYFVSGILDGMKIYMENKFC